MEPVKRKAAEEAKETEMGNEPRPQKEKRRETAEPVKALSEIMNDKTMGKEEKEKLVREMMIVRNNMSVELTIVGSIQGGWVG
jgi:hypothetical protein